MEESDGIGQWWWWQHSSYWASKPGLATGRPMEASTAAERTHRDGDGRRVSGQRPEGADGWMSWAVVERSRGKGRRLCRGVQARALALPLSRRGSAGRRRRRMPRRRRRDDRTGRDRGAIAGRPARSQRKERVEVGSVRHRQRTHASLSQKCDAGCQTKRPTAPPCCLSPWTITRQERKRR